MTRAVVMLHTSNLPCENRWFVEMYSVKCTMGLRFTTVYHNALCFQTVTNRVYEDRVFTSNTYAHREMSGLIIIIRFDNDGGLCRRMLEMMALSKCRHATMIRALWSVFTEHSTITAEIFSMGSA